MLTADEKSKLREQADEAHEAAVKASRERREMFENPACVQPPEVSELEEELKQRDHFILQRAKAIREEDMPEVKRLNEMINQAKCHVIRDLQLEEKEKRL